MLYKNLLHFTFREISESSMIETDEVKNKQKIIIFEGMDGHFMSVNSFYVFDSRFLQ